MIQDRSSKVQQFWDNF